MWAFLCVWGPTKKALEATAELHLAGHCWRTLSTQCIRAWRTQRSRTLTAENAFPNEHARKLAHSEYTLFVPETDTYTNLHTHASDTPNDLGSYAMPYAHYKYSLSGPFQCSHKCISSWLVWYRWSLRPYRLLLAVRSWSSSFSSLNFRCLTSKSSYYNSYLAGLLWWLCNIKEVKLIITAPALRSAVKVLFFHWIKYFLQFLTQWNS